MKLILGVLFVGCLFTAGTADSATVGLPRTGQTTSSVAGDDGATQRGVAWPIPRFTDKNNGTVTDNLTGLIWLKNANCTETAGGVNKSSGALTWAEAITWSNNLASGVCGLTDGSNAGQWRLPNITELESLVDAERYNPAIPAGHPFSDVRSGYYWSSSSSAFSSVYAWRVYMEYGYADYDDKSNGYYVWPVRA